MSTDALTPADDVQLAVFRVGDETYAVDIMRVREVIRSIPLTPLRQGNGVVDGILCLRGMFVPVVDLRRRFALPVLASNHRRILVVLLQGRYLGLLVDSMTEVVRVARGQLHATPHMLPHASACYLAGACQVRQTTLLLLNLNSLLAGAAEAVSVELATP